MRYIYPYILKDLKKKMVFVGGPRQVGKTTLAKAVLEDHFPSGRYFNWDFDEDRQDILRKRWSSDARLLVFDELHKFHRWKQWIKGVYDVLGSSHCILVTGSARLDVYRRGGDSLMGRYHYWRLHPFTLDELPAGITRSEAFKRLMTIGGFPDLPEDRKGMARCPGKDVSGFRCKTLYKVHLKGRVERLNPEKAVQIVATAKRPYDRNRLRVTGPLDYFQPPW